MKQSFIAAALSYTDFKNLKEFKKILKEIKPEIYKKGDKEIMRQYMIFVNSPIEETDKKNNIISVRYMDKDIKIKSKEYYKKDNTEKEITINEILDYKDSIEKEDLEETFKMTKLKTDKLFYLTENKIKNYISPDINLAKIPQIIMFQNLDTNDIDIAFRGTTNLADIITDIKMWHGINEPKYFKMVRLFIRNELFDEETKELKKEYQGNVKINFTGHSLGGALAQYANYYINRRQEILTEEYKKEGKEDYQIENLMLELKSETFNAPNIQRLLNKLGYEKEKPQCENFYLGTDDGKQQEILTYILKKDFETSEIKNTLIVLFKENMDILDSHKLPEIYNSVLLYDYLNHIYKKKNISELNEIIEKEGYQRIIQAFLYIKENNLVLIDKNDFEQILKDIKEKKFQPQENKYNFAEAMKNIFEREIEDSNRFIKKTITKIKNITMKLITDAASDYIKWYSLLYKLNIINNGEKICQNSTKQNSNPNLNLH